MKGEEGGGRFGEVFLDVRLPLGVDPADWGATMLEVGRSRGGSGEILEALGAHMTTKTDPLVRALRVALRQQRHEPRLLAKGGTADLNHAAAWNCPLAAYGPGDSRLDHTAEEHISLEEYFRSVDVLKRGISRFMGSEDEGR
jgi:LysW-gamma-L-lysine carboxypeptidase